MSDALRILNPEPMTSTEADRLASHEAVIAKGLATFVEVGNALWSIREERLYRQTHTTFRGYCEEKWNLSKSRAYQLIDAADVANTLSKNVSTMVDTPVSERHVRPLVALPKQEQPKAWQEAVAATNGKPTAKAVQEAVDRRTGKPSKPPALQPEPTPAPAPEPKPEPPVPRGFAVAEIDDPGPIEPEPELTWEPGAGPDEDADDTEEGYLESFPIRAKLGDRQRRIFDAGAILYRDMTEHRKTYQYHAVRAMNARDKRRKSAYAYQLSQHLRIEDPKHWVLCAAPEYGGCGGTGEVPTGECQACFGRGYRIK